MKPAPWRTGRKLGRTLYVRKYTDRASDEDRFLGIMDTPEDAKRVVDAVNAVVRVRELHRPARLADDGPQWCNACNNAAALILNGPGPGTVRWPCPTIRALGGDDA